MSGGAHSEPVEEQEVIVDQAPFLPQQGPPTRSRLLKAAAVGSVIAIVGTAAALVRKASIGVKTAEPASASALWADDGWGNNDHWNNDHKDHWNNDHNNNWNNNWNNQNDDGHVQCGAHDSCTCDWANYDQCSRVDAPGSPCWRCCCQAKFPQAYRQARQNGRYDRDHGYDDGFGQDGFDEDFGRPGYHGQGQHGEYHRGEEVNVKSHAGTWHPATVLQKISSGTYQVQYDVSRRVEVVHKRSMAPGMWTPWWVWVFWLCLVACGIFAVMGFVGWLVRKPKRGPFGERRDGPLAEERDRILRDENDRSCTRVCS